MALTLAPSYNIPTVSASLLASGTAAPAIAGSAGWWREKRVGAAEVAAGASQTSTAALDVDGSTYFRYPGVPAAYALAWGGGAANAIGMNPIPNSPAGSSYWAFNVETQTSGGSLLELKHNTPVTSFTMRILVDGLPVSEDAITVSGLTAGSWYAVRLTFPDARARLVTVIAFGGSATGRFGGMAVESGITLTKPSAPPLSVAFIGDGWVLGSGGVTQGQSAAWRLAHLLGGGRSPIFAGVASTGYVQTVSSISGSVFSGRVSDVLSLNPDVVIVLGGRSDPAAGTGVQAAVTALLDSIGEATQRIVAINTTTSALVSAIVSGASARNVPAVTINLGGVTLADGVNPNVAGAAVAADEYVTAINNTGSDTTLDPIGFQGTWTNVGGAASAVAALSDGLDTTYIEGPNNPSSSSCSVLLPVLSSTAASLTITPKHQASADSPVISRVVDIMQGTTVIASRNLTLSSASSAPIITLTGGEMSLMKAPRVGLKVRITDTAA